MLTGPTLTVRRYVNEVVAGNDLAALNDLVARDFVGHAPAGDFTRADLRRTLQRDRADRPGLEFIVDNLYSAGTRVITLWRYRWRHERPLFGETPTGQWLELSAITIDRVENGKITERWEIRDVWQTVQQLGGTPTFPQHVPPGA